jgi:hypothetical protein
MPSTSKKQHNLMEAVAHSPAFAKKVGIKQSIGKDFAAADKGKKFGTGGNVKYTFGGKGQVNKQRTRDGSIDGYQKAAPDVNNDKYAGLKAGGAVRTDLQKANVKKTDHGDAMLFKKGGKAMEKESKSESRKEMKEDVAQDKAIIKKAFKMHDKQEHKGGKGTNLTKLCRGGGIETKGKTKGKIV